MAPVGHGIDIAKMARSVRINHAEISPFVRLGDIILAEPIRQGAAGTG